MGNFIVKTSGKTKNKMDVIQRDTPQILGIQDGEDEQKTEKYGGVF